MNRSSTLIFRLGNTLKKFQFQKDNKIKIIKTLWWSSVFMCKCQCDRFTQKVIWLIRLIVLSLTAVKCNYKFPTALHVYQWEQEDSVYSFISTLYELQALLSPRLFTTRPPLRRFTQESLWGLSRQQQRKTEEKMESVSVRGVDSVVRSQGCI